MTVMATSDDDGHFTFALPPGRMRTAKVGAELLGVEPLDLQPDGDRLEPGDLVLIVDDGMPSHLVSRARQRSAIGRSVAVSGNEVGVALVPRQAGAQLGQEPADRARRPHDLAPRDG